METKNEAEGGSPTQNSLLSQAILAALISGFGDAIKLGNSTADQPVVIQGTDGRYLALPANYKVEEVEDSAFATPLRLCRNVTIYTVPDLIAYVNRYKNEHSLIEIVPEPTEGKICAKVTLDYHVPGEGGQRWADHSAQLQFRTSWQYQLLKTLCSGHAQPKFAVLLKDLAPYVTSMDPADLLELVRTMQLTAAGEFQNVEDEFSGSVTLRYGLSVRGTAGTDNRRLDIPERITFSIPVLLGGSPQPLTVEFYYRIPDSAASKVQMGFGIIREREMLQALSDSIRTEIVAGTQLLAITSAF